MQESKVTFPRIEARNLEGHNFFLPRDFEGERNLVLVAFKMWHQPIVDAWLPRLQELAAEHPQLRIYELPVIPAVPYIFMRWMIDGSMAASIANQQTRQTTLTIYTDVQRLTDGLEIASTETLALFLVDQSGRVFWRGQGSFDEEQFAALKQAL